MKPRFFIFCCLSAALGLPAAFAQIPPTGLDESTRLMQEYMVQRAELVALRQTTLDQVKAAKNATEKKQHLDKLAEDEKPLLTKINEAARAYKAAEKTKRDQLAQAKPRG